MQRKYNAGFTLVELMAVIAAASIVTLAATTLMLFGLRANDRTTDSIKQQSTSRILMETLEQMTRDTDIGKVENDYGTWTVYGSDKTSIRFSYSPSSQTIYAGSPEKGTPILEGVEDSAVVVDKDRRLMTFSVTTGEGTYSSTLYCRTLMPDTDEDKTVDEEIKDLQNSNLGIDNVKPDSTDIRMDFLRVLANQYKIGGTQVNNGLILDAHKKSTGKYYSEWYIGDYKSNPGWNAQTPWCACYLSWALNGFAGKGLIDGNSLPRNADGSVRSKWFASVDDYTAYFKSGTKQADGTGYYWLDNLESDQVQSGDLIVFDWNLDNDPSHIGAVLMVNKTEGRVYTIEGNTSNRVGVRSYKLTDPRILGYGVIDWAVTGS